MEYERFGQNNKLFFFGISCLVISLGLFIFSLYLLPYFIWELGYHVPEFILNLLAYFQDDYHYTSAASKTIVWFMLVIPCVITGLISYFVSHKLDKTIHGIDIAPTEEVEKPAGQMQQQIKESASIGGKIIGLMILIVVILLLLQYFVQSTV